MYERIRIASRMRLLHHIARLSYLGDYYAGIYDACGELILNDMPKINMIFSTNNYGYALYLCEQTQLGKVEQRDNVVKWTISSINEVYSFLKLINGYVRSPKWERIIQFQQYLRNTNLSTQESIYYLPVFNTLPIDTSDIWSNAWFSGLTFFLFMGTFNFSRFTDDLTGLEYVKAKMTIDLSLLMILATNL